MLIGVDCQALQTPGSRERGIGLYTRLMINHLVSLGNDEYHLFFSSAFPIPDTPPGARSHIATYVLPLAAPGIREANEYLQRLTYISQNLDLLYIPSPVDGPDAIVDVGTGRRPFPTVCTLHDLIPMVFPGAYLGDPSRKELYLHQQQSYRQADLVVAVSEHSRNDAIRLLNIPEDRIATVSSAVDPAFVSTNRERCADLLRSMPGAPSICRPFVLFTGGYDFRKNVEGTIRAFSLLPQDLRSNYELVIVCALSDVQKAALREVAARHGVHSSLVLTGYVPQGLLVALLNCCDLFVFPSLYEGFGFPVLEAMSCGAPVIAGKTSSLPEVLGDAGVMIDPYDPQAIAQAMEELLRSPDLRHSLSQLALQRAKLFSWQVTAQAMRDAFEQARTRWLRSISQARARKPRIAFFSPLPPARTGVADYSAELLPYLRRHFDIDVYIDDQAPYGVSHNGKLQHYTTPEAMRSHRYYSSLFQMGNSAFHAYMWEPLLEHQGIMVLHDIFLHDLVYWMLTQQSQLRQTYVDELQFQHGEESRIALEMLARHDIDDADIVKLFTLNERPLCASRGVIVHSEYARTELLRGRSQQLARRVRLIPQGIPIPELPTPEEKHNLRLRFSIPEPAFVVGTFGLITPSKQVELAIRAIGKIPEILYLIVGDFISPAYEAALRHLSAELGIAGRTVFTGHVPRDDFYNYLFVCDAVVSLRHPSRGETSSSLLRTLSCGIPTIVTDSGPSSELPDDTVTKVPSNSNTAGPLLNALQQFFEDPDLRARSGTAARRYAITNHSWEAAAQRYADFIHEVEATGLGDQLGLRRAIASLANAVRTDKKAGGRRLDRLISEFAGNPALGRTLWV